MKSASATRRGRAGGQAVRRQAGKVLDQLGRPRSNTLGRSKGFDDVSDLRIVAGPAELGGDSSRGAARQRRRWADCAHSGPSGQEG